MTVFNLLAEGGAGKKSTFDMPRHSVALTSFFPQLLRGHFVAAAAAFTAILSEVLVITLAGMPYHPSQILIELLLCSYTSMTILSIMIVTMVVLIIWRWRLPYLPRRPNTLGAIVSYLCASRVVAESTKRHSYVVPEKNCFEVSGNSEVPLHYAKVRGVDGVERWAVELE